MDSEAYADMNLQQGSATQRNTRAAKKRVLFFPVAVTICILFVVLLGVKLFLPGTAEPQGIEANPQIQSKPFPMERSALEGAENTDTESAALSPVAEQPRQQTIIPQTQPTDITSETLAELEEIRSITREISATLLGEGMARISEEDLASIIQVNQSLREDIAAARRETGEANSLLKSVEQEKRKLAAQITGLNDKIRQLERGRSANTGTGVSAESQAPASAANRRASARTAAAPQQKPVAGMPFSIVGLTDSFAVVKNAAGEFATVQVGQSVEGITITSIDAANNRIGTSAGDFDMKRTK